METQAPPFNVWLKQRRRALDLTQEDLSECVGCSTVTIQKIELGERRPSKQVAQRLANCLKIAEDSREEFVRFARGDTGRFDLATSNVSPSQLVQGVAEPPAPSPDNSHSSPNNLPSPLTSLLGREAATTASCGHLRRDDIRLLTFTGAPGIGKTRLCLKVAADLLPDFKDGVFFVELAPITDPLLVASAIGGTFGLAESASGTMSSDLIKYFGGKRMLLVLDNFEQVLDAAPLVLDLLRGCPGLKVLVTSREALYVPGEQVFPVSPLDLPDSAYVPPPEAMPAYPGIALFLERARAADPTFALGLENAHDVTTVCTRLDGLPLAIELAAARVTLLSMPEMSARLDKQLDLLASPARHRHLRHVPQLPERQQTMRSAIEWSYDLLEEEEQLLLSRLSVFVGGWTLEAAEAVCGPGAADGTESLLAKSLVKRPANREESRFMMLESIREYALEKLEDVDSSHDREIEELRRRHALYFLDLAERAEPHLTGEEQGKWFRRLEREHANLVAAMSWAIANGEKEISLRFGGALRLFWYDRYLGEGRWWVGGVIDILNERSNKPSVTLARALSSAALALRKTREYPQARALLEESVGIYRKLGDRLALGNALTQLAILVSEMKLPEDEELVSSLFEESLQHFEAIGRTDRVSIVLTALGELARAERDYPRAIDAFERSLAIMREIRNAQNTAAVASNLGFVLYHCGEYDRSEALLDEALLLYQETASAFNASSVLFGQAGIAHARGDSHKAAVIMGAAGALSVFGGTLYDPNDQRDREYIEATVKADFSEEGWQSAQGMGRVMSLDEAVAYVLEDG